MTAPRTPGPLHFRAVYQRGKSVFCFSSAIRMSDLALCNMPIHHYLIILNRQIKSCFPRRPPARPTRSAACRRQRCGHNTDVVIHIYHHQRKGLERETKKSLHIYIYITADLPKKSDLMDIPTAGAGVAFPPDLVVLCNGGSVPGSKTAADELWMCTAAKSPSPLWRNVGACQAFGGAFLCSTPPAGPVQPSVGP